jgi:hypothetical protein
MRLLTLLAALAAWLPQSAQAYYEVEGTDLTFDAPPDFRQTGNTPQFVMTSRSTADGRPIQAIIRFNPVEHVTECQPGIGEVTQTCSEAGLEAADCVESGGKLVRYEDGNMNTLRGGGRLAWFWTRRTRGDEALGDRIGARICVYVSLSFGSESKAHRSRSQIPPAFLESAQKEFERMLGVSIPSRAPTQETVAPRASRPSSKRKFKAYTAADVAGVDLVPLPE